MRYIATKTVTPPATPSAGLERSNAWKSSQNPARNAA